MTVNNENRAVTQKLAVFPNPTTDQIHVRIPFAGQSTVRIFIMPDGQLFQTHQVVAGAYAFPWLINLPEFMWYRSMSEDGKVVLARVVKE
jgi:hypothetical protein